MRECQICGREFETPKKFSSHLRYVHKISSHEYYDKYMKLETDGTCLYCGKETTYVDLIIGYKKYCSTTCSARSPLVQKKKSATCLKNFGVESPLRSQAVKDAFKATCLERFGSENPSQSQMIQEKKKETCRKNHGTDYPMESQEVRDKSKNTCNEKYGVDNIFQVEEIKDRAKQTWLKNYGTDNPSNTPQVRLKREQTCKERYGEAHWAQSDQIKEIHRKEFYQKLFDSDRLNYKSIPNFSYEEYTNVMQRYSWICSACNTIFEDSIDCGRTPKCPVCFPRTRGVSISEKLLVEFIRTFDVEIIENDNILLNGREIDIYIPSKKISIEYNGLYWHSSEIIRMIDIWKTKIMLSKGFRHIVVWEDDFREGFQLNYELVTDLYTLAGTCSDEDYLNNIEFFTTFTIDEIHSMDINWKKINENTELGTMVRPPRTPFMSGC
jgi:hypothetical protein